MPEIRWTQEQVEAITSTSDTLLSANAGTGKTTTVVGKILWQLGIPFGVAEETGLPLPGPDVRCDLAEIAAITFTEKAAFDLKRQLRHRIARSPKAEELQWQIDSASVGTIHSFCAALLRDYALEFGVDPSFSVLDEIEARAEVDALINEILLEGAAAKDPASLEVLAGRRLKGWTYQAGAIDNVREVMRDLRWRADQYTPWLGSEELDPAVVALIEVAQSAKQRWESWLLEENRRDFDSLVLSVRNIFREPRGVDVLEGLRKRFSLLIIDEFQDTDSAQRDIAYSIARGQDRQQLFLVGDPKQSIYRFRGADLSVWNQVADEFEDDGKVLTLSKNFRSAPPIISFVNSVCSNAFPKVSGALDEEGTPEDGVQYSPLTEGVSEDPTSYVDKVYTGKGPSAGADLIADWIMGHVGRASILDPESGTTRRLRYGDIAVLYRAHNSASPFATEFRRCGIPYFIAGAGHLGDSQEVLDILNALHLAAGDYDDLKFLGYLRSPFVSLRDEVIARIRLLQPGYTLLEQVRRWLKDGEPLPRAPEHPDLSAVEIEAIRTGIEVLDDLQKLAARLPVDELIEELLDRTGYRLHLLLLPDPEEALLNIQTLVHFAQNMRGHDLASFFQTWDRLVTEEIGFPQAPLYSRDDDVVTFTTIHQAKGLEWPVVILIGCGKRAARAIHNTYVFDRGLGPAYVPKKDLQTDRERAIGEREMARDVAEEARLFYVVMTRARTQLLLVCLEKKKPKPKKKPKWAAKKPKKEVPSYQLWCESTKPTGSGGLPPLESAEAGDDSVSGDSSRPPPLFPTLDWLDRVAFGEPPSLVESLPTPPLRWVRSATELSLKAHNEEAWERRYRHGVMAPWEFVRPEQSGDSPRARPPATVRGTIIHGVLERVETELEIAAVLEETIGSLDEPGMEWMLSPDSEYRLHLEEEIRRIVASDEWIWYTQGELHKDYWKELGFVHLRGPRDWTIGAFDLYRTSAEGAPPPLAHVLEDSAASSLVVDFKTHRVHTLEQARAAARNYDIQADVYRDAASAMERDKAAVALHFTRPNVVIKG